jgi:hypothetical protein
MGIFKSLGKDKDIFGSSLVSMEWKEMNQSRLGIGISKKFISKVAARASSSEETDGSAKLVCDPPQVPNS